MPQNVVALLLGETNPSETEAGSELHFWEYLTGPFGLGLPESNILRLLDDRSGSKKLCGIIKRFIVEHTGQRSPLNVVVYYSGRGTTSDHVGDPSLILRSTAYSLRLLLSTIDNASVDNHMLPNNRKLFILNNSSGGSPAFDREFFRSGFGTALLECGPQLMRNAAGAPQLLTSTEALLEALRKGSPEYGKLLSFRDVYGILSQNVGEGRVAVRLFVADGERAPSAADYLLFANPSYDPQSRHRDVPKIPDIKHAAIEPIWERGRVTISKKAARIDLEPRTFLTALSAVRTDIDEFVNDIPSDANIDKRAISFLRRLAERIPNDAPTQHELFKLGHAQQTLANYAKSVEEEWPAFLASQYHALSLQFDRAMRQAPIWRDFRRNAGEVSFTADEVGVAIGIAKDVAAALREEEASRFVDEAIPGVLDDLAEAAELRGGYGHDVHQRDDALDLLATDIVESVNNIFKRMAEAALFARVGVVGATLAKAGGTYAEGVAKGFAKAAKREGPKDGERAFKWLRRISVAGAGSYVGMAGLAKFPDAFSWLDTLFRHLF